MLIEKMFSLKSTELYILTDSDIKLISSRPAYEEWIAAKCPLLLSPAELKDAQDETWYSISGMTSPISTDYRTYILEHANKYNDCVYDARWKQFSATVAKHQIN